MVKPNPAFMRALKTFEIQQQPVPPIACEDHQ